MIPNPHQQGKTNEAFTLAALLRLGKRVLVPWADERYDLTLDDSGRLVRVQCKAGRICDAMRVLQDKASRTRGGHSATVDTPARSMPFATCCPEIERVYLVPTEAAPASIGARLPLEPTEKWSDLNVRWAREFELPSSDEQERRGT